MKKDLRKLTAWMLTLAMLVTLIPGFTIGAGATDFFEITEVDEVELMAAEEESEPASSAYNIWAGDKQFTSENLTISDNNGGTATYDPDTNTLTLNNFTYSGEGRLLYGRPSGATAISYDDADTLNIVLVGESSVTCNNTTTEVNSGIWVANGSVSVSGSGSLTATGGAAEFFSAGIGVAGELSVSGSVSLTGNGGASDDKSYGVMAGRNIHVIGGSLTGNGGIAGNKSYGMFVTAIDGPAAGGIKFSGGVAIAHGETDAFNIVPTINSEFTNAKVWYGESEDAADTAGAKEISELTNNYNQKYIKVADPAEITAYTITVAHTENGTVEADVPEARKGETVTLTVTPATGYELDTLSVVDSDSEDVEINENKFTMPEADVTVTATFKKVYDVFVGGTGIEDGTYLASGADEIVNKKPSGGYAYYKDGVLTLYKFKLEGAGKGYDDGEAVNAIYSKKDIEIAVTGDSLIDITGDEGEYPTSGIKALGDLTISGSKKLTVKADCPLDTEGDLDISGITLEAFGIGIYASENINITGAKVSSDCAGDHNGAIYSENGKFTVKDSTLEVKSRGAGIGAFGDISITGSDVDIDTLILGIFSNEGDITITGGETDVTFAGMIGVSSQNGKINLSGDVTVTMTEEEELGIEFICIFGDTVKVSGKLKIKGMSGIRANNVSFEGKDTEVLIVAGKTAIYAAESIGIAENLKITSPEDWAIGEYTDENENTYITISDGEDVAGVVEIKPDEDYEYPPVFVGGTEMKDGTYLASGTSETAKKKPSGGYAYYKEGTLTLNNYSYEGDGHLFDEAENSYTIVYAESSLDIVLEGTNKIVNSHYVYEGENEGFGIVVTEDLTISGNGTLNFSGDEYGVYAGGNIKVLGGNMHFDAAVGFASENGDILIGGGDIYTHSSYGLVAVGTAEIAGGEVEIFAEISAVFGGKVILSGGIIEFDTWGNLIEAMDVSISEDLMLILPAGGEIIRAEGLPHEIRDGEGNPIDYALLAPVCEHNWSVEYRINSTHHWNYCTKDCIINNYPESCEGYEPHSEDGECICGYDVNKEAEIYIGGVGLASGEYLSTGGALSQEKPDGGYAYYDEGTLTLKNFEFKGTGYDYYYEDYYDDYYEGNALIYTEDNLDIVITGENRIEAVREEFDGIFSYGGDITVSGKGSLTLIGGDDAIGTYEGDVTIKSGTLTLEAKDDDGIDIYGGNLYVKGGTINITSDDHGMDISAGEESPDSGKVTITGGKIIMNAGDEGFDAEGYVKITGGTINVTAYDIPIDAYNGIMIKGGKLTLVSESDEGIWVMGDFEMTGGTLDITAVTQGIEATCYIGEDGSPLNKGGNIYIDGGELNVTVTEGYALFAEDDIEIDKALTIKTPKNAKIIDAQYTEDAVTYEGVTVGRSGEGAKEVEIKKESSGGGGGSSKGSSSSGGIKISTGTPALPVVPAPGTTGGQTPAKKEFTDVHPLGHWASADIDYVYANGLMKGISETEFSPEAPLTRAMLVTVLYRIEGEPATNRSIPFSDVDMGAYYANAVSWAKQVGIVMGVTETEFAPDLNISREQIAAIMHRYAEYKGYDVTQGGMLIREFDDYEEISEYALAAMAWTVNSGLLKGKGENSLAPEENATRAETAAILHRFIEGNK